MSIDCSRRTPVAPRIVLSVSFLAVLGLLVWAFSQMRSDHWEEVARAQAYLDHGEVDLAFQAISGIRDDRPGAAEGLTLAARALLMRGNIPTARRVLERTLLMKREQPEAAKMLAAIYLAAGDGQRAIALLEMAARLEPGDFRPWYALGKVFHDTGELDRSAGAYSEALRRNPPAAESREARIGRARAQLDSNHPEEAVEDLIALRRETPDDPMVLAMAASQARERGRPEEALELANRALAADPASCEALMVRARVRIRARETQRAIDDLEAALRAKPDDRAALQLLSQCQMSLGLMREAKTTMERADRARKRIELMDRLSKTIDERPEDPEPRWRLGQAAMDGQMYVLAYQCFQAALYLDPNYKPARQSLEALRSVKGFDPGSLQASQVRPFAGPEANRR